MKFEQPIADFIAYTKTQPDAEWLVKSVWAPGWMIEIQVAQRFIRMEPKVARKLLRYLDGEWRAAFLRTPEAKRDRLKEAQITAWLAKADKIAKGAMHLAREGMVPA